jgi:hypothetical protein
MSNALAESRGRIPRRASGQVQPANALRKGLPFAAILGETPTKIYKAALSRRCGTPRRISPQFALKDVAVSGF